MVHGVDGQDFAASTFNAGRTKKSEKPAPASRKTAKNAAMQPLGLAFWIFCCKRGTAGVPSPSARQRKYSPPPPTATNSNGSRMAKPNHRLGRRKAADCGLAGFT